MIIMNFLYTVCFDDQKLENEWAKAIESLLTMTNGTDEQKITTLAVDIFQY